MAYEVRMPRVDEDMKEGTIVRWFKKEGESVGKNEPIVEIETQKVNYEIESPESGVLRLILAREEQSVPINGLLAIIAQLGEDISAYEKLAIDKSGMKEERLIVSRSAPVLSKDEIYGMGVERKRTLITPAGRKIASEMGFDISRIKGTGPSGRITREDVLRAGSVEKGETRSSSEVGLGDSIEFSGMRKTIAEKMTESWLNSPRAENFMSADVTEFMKIREECQELWNEKGIQPSINDFIITVTARALREFPIANASLRESKILINENVNINVAVAAERGLVTPVVRQADSLDIFDIAKEARRLVDLVRTGKQTTEILIGGTFTITNLGMFGVEFFVPIINPPQAAILAVGMVQKKPIIINDAIAIRSMIHLCLAYDHRLLDGVVAAKFLQSIKSKLENPSPWFLRV